MPGANQAQSLGWGEVRFALKVQDVTLEVNARLPEGPVQPAVLLPILQDLSNSISELARRNEEKAGRQISCREGCSACCWQAVAIAPAEARRISEWLAERPEECQTVLHERFRKAAARLEDSGIAQSLRAASHRLSREATLELGLRYSALSIPCPFLEDGRCSIYAIRPMRCREYMVVSPPEHCAHPETNEIVGVKPPVLLSRILNRWDASGDVQDGGLILLAMLDEWVANHPPERDRIHRSAPELLQEFLHAFAKDASVAPADPRESIPANNIRGHNPTENSHEPIA